MKKILLSIVVIFSVLIISGCSNESKYFINFKDDFGYDTPSNVTYKFTGTSEHFGFETGKVYYGDEDQRYILLTNFKIIKNIDKQNEIEKFSVNLSFNDISMFTNEFIDLNESSLENKIKELSIEETGKYSKDKYGESDSFLETTKDDFKSSFKFEIKYCYRNDICKTEKLKLNYIN